jgi:hypothetical protein
MNEELSREVKVLSHDFCRIDDRIEESGSRRE